MLKRKELIKKLRAEEFGSSIKVINFQAYDGGHRALVKIKQDEVSLTTWFFSKLTDEKSAIRDIETRALADFLSPEDYVSDDAPEPVTKKKTKKKPRTKNVVFNREEQTHINLVVGMLNDKFKDKWREHAPIIKSYNDRITGKIDFLDTKGNLLPEFIDAYVNELKGVLA